MTPQSEPEAVPGAVPVHPPDTEAVVVAPSSDAPPVATPAPVDEGIWSAPVDWQRLPPRAKRVFLYVALMVAVPPTLVASAMLYESLPSYAWPWLVIAGLWTVSLSFAFWVAYKRYQYTFWKLDADGFAVRRGRLWQWETRVPTSRVQHLDIKRGPLERSHRLASLVLHTAGTRMSAVSISGLDEADAERLRDHFSRQIDRQEDDDHADA
jgi:uncharacterized protein